MLSGAARTLRTHSRIGLGVLVPAVAIAAALATGRGAHAEGSDQDQTEAKERCAIRLSIALLGKSADPGQITAADPQSAVDGMVDSPDFAEQWARFVNSEFNGGPATSATADPVYYMAKYIVTQKKPWTDAFIGPYTVAATTDAMEVKDDPNGLGYFRSPSWMQRYAGNESAGYMLSAAFRIIHNTTGITLTPSVGNPGDDRTATGRANQPCRQCHFDAWYALDTFAKLLPRRKGQGDQMTFTPPTDGPQMLLGKQLADDKAMVNALVDSDAWRFNQCRVVFKFLYGRPENQCEAKVFDACVDALSQKKTIQAAVATVAKDPSFCQ